MIAHDAQGWTRAGTGQSLLCGGMGKPASVIAHDQNQSRPYPARTTSLSRVELSRALHLAGLRGQCYAARFSVPFRRCALARGPQFGFSDHVPGQFADRSEAHVQRPLYVVGFNTDEHMKRHREPCSRNQRKSYSP